MEERTSWSAGRRSQTVVRNITELVSNPYSYPSNPVIADGRTKTADLKIQALARDSYDGDIIHISHRLRVVADMRQPSQIPEISSPVYIQSEPGEVTRLSPEFVTASSVPNLNVPSEPNDKQEAYNSVPPGWSPSVLSDVIKVHSNGFITIGAVGLK